MIDRSVPVVASRPVQKHELWSLAEVLAPSQLMAAWMLCKREMVRFFRQPTRIVGAIGTPALFWLLFGTGLDKSFRITTQGGAGENFREYYFPGSLMLIVLFTAIFTTISVIEDRREGFLQSVLVSPISRWAMVLGKVLGGTLIALSQALIFLILAVTLKSELTAWSLVQLVALLFIASLALTSVGFVFAWNSESTQGFHAIMNLVLMPMWLLSGAFFPAPTITSETPWSQQALHWAIRLNPLSYAVAGARRLVFGNIDWQGFWMPPMEVCWIVTFLFAVAAFAAAVAASGRRTSGDLL